MLIQAAVSFGTVIMFGSAGEILTEKSGNLNLGVPGMMYLCGLHPDVGGVHVDDIAVNEHLPGIS